LAYLVRAKEVKAEMACRPTEIDADVAEARHGDAEMVWCPAIVESAEWMMARR
jgi:hypothetical protein